MATCPPCAVLDAVNAGGAGVNDGGIHWLMLGILLLASSWSWPRAGLRPWGTTTQHRKTSGVGAASHLETTEWINGRAEQGCSGCRYRGMFKAPLAGGRLLERSHATHFSLLRIGNVCVTVTRVLPKGRRRVDAVLRGKFEDRVEPG